MLAVKTVATNLQQLFNQDSELTYLVTENVQDWFDYNVKDKDGNNYIPMVVIPQPTPVITTYYTTRTLEYLISLKGLAKSKDKVETFINNNASVEVDGNEWKLSNFITEDIKTSEDKKEFFATFRLSIFVQTFVTGNDIEVSIDGTKVNVVAIGGSFDKMLLPNIAYGSGNNMTATGSEFTIPMILDVNTAAIFGSVADNTYNKAYLIKLDLKAVEIEFNAVLTGGSLNIAINNQPITFNARFIKALPRNTITINGDTVPVIGLTVQMSSTPAPRQDDKRLRNRASSATYAYNLQIINDGSTAATALKNEINNHTNAKFTLVYDGISRDCIVLNGVIPNAEQPNAVINVTLGDGYFD